MIAVAITVTEPAMGATPATEVAGGAIGKVQSGGDGEFTYSTIPSKQGKKC